MARYRARVDANHRRSEVLGMGKILKLTAWDVQEVYMPPGSVVLFHLSEPRSSVNRTLIANELSEKMGSIPWLLLPSAITVSVLVPGVGTD